MGFACPKRMIRVPHESALPAAAIRSPDVRRFFQAVLTAPAWAKASSVASKANMIDAWRFL